MNIYESFIEKQIHTLKANLTLAIGWCLGIFLLGIIATIVLYSLSSTNELSELTKIGPGLITSAISSFQLKTITVNRERITTFRSLSEIVKNWDELAQTEKEKLENILIDTVKGAGAR